ncbi:MAG: nuclear transport factor 2 family protein [Balneolaceae bacterium]|nr:nuclear transport factor 2 family protein [Balneolaceae bacterium]
MKIFLLSVMLICCTTSIFGQYQSDTESIQSTIDALYEVISGEAGEARDWDRFKNLFAPDGRLIPTYTDREGNIGYLSWTPEEYIERAGSSLERDGFFESEIGQVVEQFGNIAHVFSTYDSRRTKEGEVFMRGINSIQLFNDGNRWWIISVFWSSENPANPIPAKYINR